MAKMREYLGRSGNIVYLINLDTNECESFNKFGKMEGKTTGILGYAGSKSLVEIDILSLIGDPVMSICEIYFNGYKGTVPIGYSEVLSRLSGKLSLVDPVIYRVVHPEGVMQILLPCRKGKLINKELEQLLGMSIVWSSL